MSNTPSERGSASVRERRSYQDLAKLASSPSLTPAAPKSVPKVETAPPSSSAGKETDSGIVDLKLLAQVDPNAGERAKTTELASAALFDDDEAPSERSPGSQPHVVQAVASVLSTRTPGGFPSPPRVADARRPVSAVAQVTPAKRSPLWMGAGAAAVLGIAAAALLMVRSSHRDGAPAVAAAPSPPAAVAAVGTSTAAPAATNAATPQPQPVASNDVAKDNGLGGSKAAVASKSGKPFMPRQGAVKWSKSPGSTPAPPADPNLVATNVPPSPTQSGSLSDALRQAAGTTPSGDSDKSSAQSTPEFAPGSVPQKPSQGAVTGALGAAMPGARGCLGPDDPVSRATIVFDSSGAVSQVTVSGAAAGKPAEACIKAALSKAKVPPFAQSSYTATATIRPNSN